MDDLLSFSLPIIFICVFSFHLSMLVCPMFILFHWKGRNICPFIWDIKTLQDFLIVNGMPAQKPLTLMILHYCLHAHKRWVDETVFLIGNGTLCILTPAIVWISELTFVTLFYSCPLFSSIYMYMYSCPHILHLGQLFCVYFCRQETCSEQYPYGTEKMLQSPCRFSFHFGWWIG
jgi:hypothetical protein